MSPSTLVLWPPTSSLQERHRPNSSLRFSLTSVHGKVRAMRAAGHWYSAHAEFADVAGTWDRVDGFEPLCL